METKDDIIKVVKRRWLKFKTDSGLECAYQCCGDGNYKVKVISGVPRGLYYSFLNDALMYFEDVLEPELRSNGKV